MGGNEVFRKRPLPDQTTSIPKEPETDSPWVIWRPKEAFQPEAINAALGTKAKVIDHALHGHGFLWELTAGSEVSNRLEVFPGRALARVRLADGPEDYQTRQYAIDTITARIHSGGLVLSILSKWAGRYSIVNLYPNGEIHEFHRLAQVPSPGLPPPDFVQGSTLTIDQAAQIIGCKRASVEYLIRRSRLPAAKLGRQWLLEAQPVYSYKRSRRGLNRKSSSNLQGDALEP